jgi:phage tail sheath protein FI
MSGHEINASKSMREILENIGYSAKAISSANQYAAIFGPKVEYVMSDKAVEDFGGNKTFPASFHYLACAARTFDRYKEWYAVAGYNRGVSNYSIETTSVKLGEIAINTLAPRIANGYTTKSVNLILHERGNYYLWGNRTGYTLTADGIVFHHFLNIRQLCCSIKKQLYTACKQFTFDPNSDLLWINFVNAIKPTLDAMKADQGIKGYTITRTANDKKALLTARIRIVPIEAVEDFDISIYLEDSLTGITVNTSEEQA